MKRLCITVILSLFLINPTSMVGAVGTYKNLTLFAPSLLNSLRQGGYILYVRHGEATEGEDQPNFNFENCATQRNLSMSGRKQAVQFGKALRDLKIPLQVPVLASPFCRTRETAALAFGKSDVQTDPFWVNVNNLSASLPYAQQQATLVALTSVLEQIPAPGTNRVIVAHSFPDGVGLGKISPLTTVVVKPRGHGKGFEIVDRIPFDELLRLQEKTLPM
ncbi:histidine phosphatase family protein [Paenibacillus alginolyticus]|uniref:Histidine phosphatase family protein n=1 Tax=Paenibacillus alginolyticus TaxID=59839 RepID=A0ABT4G7U7_9BACL|nr:histidine phosphatase family protein [Paenibacillus alginolyticus]MCY9692258.1 histidine phosphatase family protein [Paenibacillus alginolyticus]